MRVLVTGANGFIGQYLTKHLLEAGHFVYRLDVDYTPVTYYNRVKESKCTTINEIKHLDFDFIFHLASYSRVQGSDDNRNIVFQSNVDLLIEVLEYSKEHNTPILFTSTSYIFANPYANAYGVTKKIGEDICEYYRQRFNVDVRVCRLFDVYGNRLENYPEWKLGVVDLFVKLKRGNREYHINNSGDQRRDYVHIDDVCRGLLAISANGKAGVLYQIGSKENFSVNEVANFIFFEKPPENRFDVSGEVHYIVCEDVSAMRDLGWKAEINLKEYLLSTTKG